MSRSSPKARQARVARFGNREHWARLRVRLRKPKEVVRQGVRQNYEIGLDVAGGQSRRRPRKALRTNAPPLACRGFGATIEP